MFHQSVISGISSSKAGDYLATAGYDNKVILWESYNHTPVAIGMHDHLANQVCFSPCGKFLLSSSSDYSARLWSLPELNLLAVMHHEDDVEGISFSPDSKYIATSSRDHSVRVFDIKGELIHNFIGHLADVISVDWLSNEKLVSCGDDSTIRYWNVTNKEQVNVVDLGGVETDTLCVVNEDLIITGDDDGYIRMFDGKMNSLFSCCAHSSGIKRLVCEGTRFVSLSYDRSIKVWNVDNKSVEVLAESSVPDIVWPRSCTFINQSQLGFVTFGDRYAIFNLDTNEWNNIDSINHTKGINGLLSSNNDLFSVGDSGTVRKNGEPVFHLDSLCNFLCICGDDILTGGQNGSVYNALNGEKYYSHNCPLNCAQSVTIANVDYVFIGTYAGEVLVLKKEGSRYHYHVSLELHNNAIKDLVVANNICFSVCADTSVKLHHIEFDQFITMSLITSGNHDRIVNSCDWIEDGFISVGRDRILNIWSNINKKEVSTHHKHSIKCVASNNIEYILSGDYRGGIQLYNTQTEEKSFKRISLSGISDIAYSKQRKCFFVSNYEGCIFEVHPEVALNGWTHKLIP
ncbi:hypothetical protein ACPFUZ_003337 [Vibrio cholerae]